MPRKELQKLLFVRMLAPPLQRLRLPWRFFRQVDQSAINDADSCPRRCEMAGKPARNVAPQFIELRRRNVARPGELDAAIQQDAHCEIAVMPQLSSPEKAKVDDPVFHRRW